MMETWMVALAVVLIVGAVANVLLACYMLVLVWAKRLTDRLFVRE